MKMVYNQQSLRKVITLITALYLLFKVILKLHTPTFPAWSVALQKTSVELGTGKIPPFSLLQQIAGGAPELSVAEGFCQKIRASSNVSSFMMLFGQYVKIGASWSETRIKTN